MNYIINALFLLLGSLILCAYSLHTLMLCIKRDPNKLSQAVLGTVVSYSPIIIVPCILSIVFENGGFFLMIVSSFFMGIGWTKKWWGFVAEIEADIEENYFEEIEVVEFPYNELRREINKLCIQSGLTDIELFLSSEKSINGYAKANHLIPHSITLTKGCLKLRWPEIAAIVGHEIIHIKHRDNTYVAFLWRIGGAFLLILFFIAYLFFINVINSVYTLLGTILTFITFPIMLFYEIFLLIFLVIDNRRYWYQIQELRADRLACELPGIEQFAIEAFLTRQALSEEEYFRNLPWYKKIYSRYFILHEHPSAKYRLRIIKKYRKWSYKDYIIHILQVTKWFFTGKGWNGY